MPSKKSVKEQSSHKTKSKKLQIILLVIIVAGLLYYIKGLFVVAIVNGTPISRVSVIKELEREQGKVALDWLITKNLISQEAKKRKISVTQQDIDGEMKKMEKSLVASGQSLDQALAAQGISRQNLTDRIKITKLLEKMFDKDVVVTDKEVEDFIEKNKDSFPPDTDTSKIKETVKQQLKAQKIDQKGSELVSKLKKEAKIQYFVNY